MSEAEGKHSARERLLQAADELFYNDGVHTVGIDRVIAQAGVAKASLYSIFGSKDELVREYLRGRDERLRERIMLRLARIKDPRVQLLAVFDGLGARVAEGAYHGCPFIRASAEGPPGPNASRQVAAEHRAWRRQLFAQLATQAGVPDASELSQQLSLLYDGAATSVVLDADDGAPLLARKAAERLLDAALSSKKLPSKKMAARRQSRSQ